MLKVKDHSDMLSAQYLVNYLDEDHVCHGITTQEPRPRPMKETLHSRHHSTVLPRLCASRKESLRNLYTNAVDSATKLLGNNRVVKERPPSISDEEQRLNRRQRCTLSLSYDQGIAIYCRTTCIGFSANQSTSVQTVGLHHKI